MTLSKKYKDAMNKITVDDQMKNRILKNINNDKEADSSKYIQIKNTKKIKYNYYRGLGVIAACCAVIIYTLNNKEILNSYNFNRNSVKNTEIAFNKSENSNENTRVRRNIEDNFEKNEIDTSENSKSLYDESSNSDVINNNSKNSNNTNTISNSQNNDSSSEEESKTKTINKDSYNNENSQNNISINEDNNNIKEAKTSSIELEKNRNSQNKISESSYIGMSIWKEFRTLEELKQSVDFIIKTPKVQSESNEIKSIIMDSNKNISIDYEKKDYSFTFKIQREVNEDNSDSIHVEREKVINIDENSVLLRGNSDVINIASWEEGTTNFQIKSIVGIKEEDMINIIKNIE